MSTTESTLIDELYFYFVVKHDLPDEKYELSLSNYAPFRDDRTTFPFDTETDAALYLLDEFTRGAIVSSNDIETAKAIINGQQPTFVYEAKQPDGTLLLSLHDALPPKNAKITVFGGRSAKMLARFLLRRLNEGAHIQATEETVKRAQSLLDAY